MENINTAIKQNKRYFNLKNNFLDNKKQLRVRKKNMNLKCEFREILITKYSRLSLSRLLSISAIFLSLSRTFYISNKIFGPLGVRDCIYSSLFITRSRIEELKSVRVKESNYRGKLTEGT